MSKDKHKTTKKFRLRVSFYAPPVEVEVEGKSVRDVWERRHELAAQVQPQTWKPESLSVEEIEND